MGPLEFVVRDDLAQGRGGPGQALVQGDGGGDEGFVEGGLGLLDDGACSVALPADKVWLTCRMLPRRPCQVTCQCRGEIEGPVKLECKDDRVDEGVGGDGPEGPFEHG